MSEIQIIKEDMEWKMIMQPQVLSHFQLQGDLKS
jgi:hypothetical protein